MGSSFSWILVILIIDYLNLLVMISSPISFRVELEFTLSLLKDVVVTSMLSGLLGNCLLMLPYLVAH